VYPSTILLGRFLLKSISLSTFPAVTVICLTMQSFSVLVIAVAIAVLGGNTSAFGVGYVPTNKASKTSLNFFGGLKDAFKNEEMGERQNAGLTNGPKFNDQVTVNGKAVQGAVAGQKLTVVAGRARVKIPVNCQKGDCGTCIVKLNGRQVKGKNPSADALSSIASRFVNLIRCILRLIYLSACQTPLPAGKATIQTL